MKRVLAGPHAVLEALRASPGAIEAVLVVESMRPMSADRIEEQSRIARVPCETVAREVADALAGALSHQGVIAITGAYPYQDLEALLRHADGKTEPIVLVLDQVQDPQNLGAIMRSAHAFGASGIVLLKDRAAGVTGAAVRSSAGASELIKTARVTNLVKTLEEMKRSGYQILGAAVEGGTDIRNIDWRGKTAIVLGNEAKGIRRLTAVHCDRLFTIPLAASFDSLNVSAAAAVSMFEASKHRIATKDESHRREPA